MKDGTIGCNGVGIDKYGRTLVRCSSSRLDVNREMVANGWAVAYGDYHAEERQSRTGKLGIWAGEFDMPKDWRDTHGDVIDTNADHGLLNSLQAKARMWMATILNYFKG